MADLSCNVCNGVCAYRRIRARVYTVIKEECVARVAGCVFGRPLEGLTP